MSGTIPEDEDDLRPNGHVNGGAISDDDVRAMLAQERKERQRVTAELERERTARTRAEGAVSTHATARFDAEEAAVAARLEGADAAAAGLRKQYSEALAEGRFDDAADVQDKMSELRAKQAQDRQYQTWLAGEKTRLATVQQPANEGVDLSNYSAAQRKWIRANPEFMDDAKVRAKTFAGHQLAIAEGVEVDSPEYFELIDEVVHRGKRQVRQEPDDEGEVVVRPAPKMRERPSVDMPVTRRTPQTAERQKEIRLSADEREAADISLPDRPVDGRMDKDGNWIPGRYEAYSIQRAKIRAQGRG